MERNPTIVFPAPGKVVIEERPKPAPQTGELLIQSRCSLISTGTELTLLQGNYPAASAWARYGHYPVTPGYSNIGQVVDIGVGVEPNWVGRTVATYGKHALFVTAQVEDARLVPSQIPDEQAVFFTIAEIVLNGVRRSDICLGESVVIYGLGLLGQLTARFCRLSGARPVIGVDMADSRLARFPEDAGLFALNSARDDVEAAVRRLTRGRMADVVFEVTGDPHLIPAEFAVLRKQGRFVVLSSPRGKTRFDFHDLCNAPSYTIIGAHNSSHPEQATLFNPWTKHRHAELFFDLVADGELDLRPLISHRAPFARAPELYQMLMEDRSQAMGVLFLWSA